VEQFGNAVFVSAHPRLGSVLITGTVTGRAYHIRSSGGWVHIHDYADVISREKHTACCGKIPAVLDSVPSAEQIRQLPVWAYEPVPAVLDKVCIDPTVIGTLVDDVVRPDVTKQRKVRIRRVVYE